MSGQSGIVPSPETQPCVLIAMGEMGAEDEMVIGRLLGRFGLTTTFLTAEEYRLHFTEGNKNNAQHTQLELIERNGYRFLDITSPFHIVLREHFEDFQKKMLPGSEKGITTRAFHTLVNGRGDSSSSGRLFRWRNEQGYLHNEQGWSQYREPAPLSGIKIIKRAAMDFEPYAKTLSDIGAKIMAQYGIVAGSIPTALEYLEYTTPHSQTEITLSAICSKLKRQISEI